MLKKKIAIAGLMLVTTMAFAVDKGPEQGSDNLVGQAAKSASVLTGTWRLRSYTVWSPDGKATFPIGEQPMGFAIFTPGGRAFFQLARGLDPAAAVADGDKKAIAESFGAYFGRVEHHPSRDEFTIVVEASNQADFIGSRQIRPYRIKGDELRLGVPGQFEAVLQREQNAEAH